MTDDPLRDALAEALLHSRWQHHAFPDDETQAWSSGVLADAILAHPAVIAARSEPAGLREALGRAIAGGYSDDSIDTDLYQNDPVYHAVVYEVRQHRLAATPTASPTEDEL